MNNRFCVTLATLESHNHILGDIERGIKIYERGGIDFIEQEPGFFLVRVPHKGNMKTVSLKFTPDGQDLEHHHCDCCWHSRNPICRHKVAAVLAIQGGIPASNLVLGKTYWFESCVADKDTARAIGSGNLDVLATPVLITLMERSAYMLLEDELDEGQTSVGTNISISHTVSSPVGIMLEIEAKITSVRGRTITFEVCASDEVGEIGKGTHTRVIVSEKRLLEKANERLSKEV